MSEEKTDDLDFNFDEKKDRLKVSSLVRFIFHLHYKFLEELKEDISYDVQGKIFKIMCDEVVRLGKVWKEQDKKESEKEKRLEIEEK